MGTKKQNNKTTGEETGEQTNTQILYRPPSAKLQYLYCLRPIRPGEGGKKSPTKKNKKGQKKNKTKTQTNKRTKKRENNKPLINNIISQTMFLRKVPDHEKDPSKNKTRQKNKRKKTKREKKQHHPTSTIHNNTRLPVPCSPIASCRRK